MQKGSERPGNQPRKEKESEWKGRCGAGRVRLADRFDGIWFESIYDVNYFWIRFCCLEFQDETRKKSCHNPMTPQTLLPILEESWFSDPRKSNAPDALDEYARLKSAYLSPLVSRSKETDLMKISYGICYGRLLP